MKLIATALLSVSAFALIAPAASAQNQRQYQSYQECESAREGRQVTGAIIGGILGAIIGNEIADDSNNNRHANTNRRSRGRGHHRRNYRHRDRGNSEEVGTIAGAGVGALIGAGVAGGEECDQYRQRQNDNRYLDKPPAYQQGAVQQPAYEQQGSYTDSYYIEDGQGYASSNVELEGGNASTSRTYNASSSDWNCEWTSSSRQNSSGQITTDQIYMCEGGDGIWRPYDTYVNN